MAVIDYRLVYRDGAATGALVLSMKMADTQTELLATGAPNGDLGFSKDNNQLWVVSGNAWKVVYPAAAPPAFNGGTITNGLLIRSDVANPSQLTIEAPSYTHKLRLIHGNDAFLTHNIVYAWARDNPNTPGLLLGLQTNGFGFYVITSGNSLVEVARINLSGDITARNETLSGYLDIAASARARNWFYEFSRSQAMGAIYDFTPEVWCDVGSFTMSANYTSAYSVRGNEMNIHFLWDFSFSNQHNNTYLRLPAGASVYKYTTGFCNYIQGGNQAMVRMQPEAGQNYITMIRADGGPLYAGTARLQGQIIVPISGI